MSRKGKVSVEKDEAQADGKKGNAAEDVDDNKGKKAHHGRVRDRRVPFAVRVWVWLWLWLWL